jgi:arylsulfatase A-like enzyme
MRRAAWIIAGLAAAVFVAIGTWTWLKTSPPPTYDPVVATTALASWKAPWPDVAAAQGPATPKRWIVIGWDGADWKYVLPLLDAGKLPHLAALMQEGAYGAMRSFKPTWSPVLWTTVATGVDPGRHGILAWGRTAKSGARQRRLFTNADRRVHAIWNLLTERGRTALIVGYHNTYPAERVEGIMVSNYLYHEHLLDLMAAHDDSSDRASSLVYPPGRLKEILEVQHAVGASLPQAISRFAHFDAAEANAFTAPLKRALGRDDDRRRYFLKKAYLFDEFDGRVAAAEYPRVHPDLMMVHFQCIDLAGHYFLYFHDPRAFDSMPWTEGQKAALAAEMHNYRDTIESFYRFADEWLGTLRALAPPDTGVLLLSDHGFEPEPDPERTGYHVSAPPGIFVVAGPGVRPGMRVEGASLYDVFPTLAATLGLPVASDLRGAPRGDWFTAGAWSGLSIAKVGSYDPGGRYVPDVPAPDARETELLEQLKAIGYVD